MNIGQMAADAKERIHRGVGQRARWAHRDIAQKAEHLRAVHETLWRSRMPPADPRLALRLDIPYPLIA